MPEIDQSLAKLDEFFDAGGVEHSDILAKSLSTTIKIVKRGYVDRELDDEKLVARIDDVVARLKELETDPPPDLVVLKQRFREAALEVMACRRSMLPLQLSHRPGVTVDPRETLYDDEDLYGFAVHDSLADEVTRLIGALQDPPGEDEDDTVAASA